MKRFKGVASSKLCNEMAFRGQSTKYKCLKNFALYGSKSIERERVSNVAAYCTSDVCGEYRDFLYLSQAWNLHTDPSKCG